MINSHLLVMAGGRGTRFWPVSTSKEPKHYLKLLGGDESLLMKTLKRFDDLIPFERRHIITVSDQVELALKNSNNTDIIEEPAGRNTAPCIFLALSSLLKNGAGCDDVVVIVPSDHVIINTKAYREKISDAINAASALKKIVTIGISPTFPHTGFGYIEAGEEVKNGFFKVNSFKEKPNAQTAVKYLETGKYLWNAGMFVAPIGVLLEEFSKHAPEIFIQFEKLTTALPDREAVKRVYENLPKISVDYAIMEKSANVLTTPSNFDWNDLGSWDALETVVEKQNGNTIISNEEAYFEDASGNIVYAPNQFVSMVGVDDLIVVSKEGALMILKKSEAQKVKNIVTHLEGRPLGKNLL